MKNNIFLSYLLLLVAFLLPQIVLADVHDDFNQRRLEVNNDDLFSIFTTEMDDDTRHALEFLYAYMPSADMANYDGTFFFENAQLALEARRTMSWGKKVPEREWRHFVLPVRVNNEDLDRSRTLFYQMLSERVKGLSMKEAALEVNHWCHEWVTYAPSDGRTRSPYNTMRNHIGRCGEESTFCVAAMRSIGIPARQVYTPRWAHTDDNHAWVEVWVDGKWHFLGACEPEPVLDLGWFNAPASRGMLMHTKVFGSYDGPEEVMNRNNCFTEIDVTANYAPVSKARVRVVDTEGNPVPALVEFKLYNYAEFYTVAQKQADANGFASLTCGRGDLLIWASHEGMFGLKKYKVGKDNMVTVVLDKGNAFFGSFDIDITPPVERNTVPKLTKKQVEKNKRRLAEEDSIRNAAVAKFASTTKADLLAELLHLDKERLTPLLLKARANIAPITFLNQHPNSKAIIMLETLKDKDLCDIDDLVLNLHYEYSDSVTALDDNAYYMLSPRISNEMITPWRSYLKEHFDQQLLKAGKTNPSLLVQWTKDNIMVVDDWNPQHLCMHPERVFDTRMADSHSRDIFFVALARTAGCQARIDEVTGKTQYRTTDDLWMDVEWQETTAATLSPQGVLRADYVNNGLLDDPKYYTHFTISEMKGGRAHLLNYPEEGVTWSNLLKDGERLSEGSYLIVTGQRMANGSVMAHLEFIPVFYGAIVDARLLMRQSEEEVQVIGVFNSENIYADDEAGEKSILSTTGRGYYVLGLIEPNHEPTNHALRDIALLKNDLEKWGQKMVLLFRDEDEKNRFSNRSDFQNLPSTVVWGTDVNGKIYEEVAREMKLNDAQQPIFLICDTFNRVVFVSSGYTIGLGEQLLKVIKKL